MDEIPYAVLMMMNAVIPDYKSDDKGGSGTGSNKSMSLFDIAAAVERREGV